MENKDDDEDDDRPERRIDKGVVPEAMFNFQFGSSMLMELPLPLLPWWARIYRLQGTEMKGEKKWGWCRRGRGEEVGGFGLGVRGVQVSGFTYL